MEEEIADIVRDEGWYAANVADAEPPFLYSIGLMKTFEHAEFIVFGLDVNDAYALLSGLIANIQTGSSYESPGIFEVHIHGANHRLGFRFADPTQHPLYLGFAMGFCTNMGRFGELRAVQVFWPDDSGKFPFEIGCDPDVHNLQPRLDLAMTPREIRKFQRQWGG